MLALTFIFGDAVKNVFEGSIYLFIEHPFDVGDALLMPSGLVWRVKQVWVCTCVRVFACVCWGLSAGRVGIVCRRRCRRRVRRAPAPAYNRNNTCSPNNTQQNL